MLLAATGTRPTEALYIQIKDIDFEKHPAELYVRGENTKIRAYRTIFLTEEITKQIKAWLKFKHRTRRVCHHIKERNEGNIDKKTINEYRTPSLKKTDLLFASASNINQHQVLVHYILICQGHLPKH
jgi:integrase